ncbi:hypothetical protein B0J14DRAFT_661497 [Halenospora varia]|nr:hypothetical protein B0J14DRAFT_661497 [Halenospora varia]
MSGSPFSLEIIVTGGGLAGLGAYIPLALSNASYHITVLERTPTLQAIGSALLAPPQRIPYEGAVELGVKVRFDGKLTTTDSTKPSVAISTSNGEEVLEADLIIGADGANSKVRTAVLGNEIKPPVDEIAYICSIPGSTMIPTPLQHP